VQALLHGEHYTRVSEYDSFADDYDAWAADMTEDVAWYVELAREAGEPLVELAVGSGRVAIPIARETGKRVIGIDRSPAMLAVARERAAGLPVELREGDMRELSLEEPVDLVICPFRSLIHLQTWADKRRVFERVAASLRPGGRFAWNAFAFSPLIAAELHNRRLEHESGLWEINRYIPADSRIELTRGRGDETLGTLRAWWVTKSEWDGLVDVAGLEVESLYGGFNREPFDDESLELVYVARKHGRRLDGARQDAEVPALPAPEQL
jgi:ubiquinone/menaquinone biosynthesis C-methylase UbiE